MSKTIDKVRFNECLTVQEFKNYLNLSDQTFYNFKSRGKVKTTQFAMIDIILISDIHNIPKHYENRLKNLLKHTFCNRTKYLITQLLTKIES